MKKIISLAIVVIVVIAVLVGLYLSTGKARSDVYLADFSFDEESNTITLHVNVATSAGYVRDMKVKQGGDNKYITFYSTYGFNSPNGAIDTFEVSLNKSATEIYFYAGQGGYTKVLEKNDDTGEWFRVNELQTDIEYDEAYAPTN